MNDMIPFHKYQGAGNDFVLVDNRSTHYIRRSDTALIRTICDRRFGIGADGLMLLQNAPGYDFEMVYFNSDGQESTMCGNGGRCIAAFAQKLGICHNPCRFLAVDGPHEAILSRKDWVELRLSDVPSVEAAGGDFLLDTGSPHYVRFVEDLGLIDVVEQGRALRYSERFRTEGINVNFVADRGGEIEVSTYERGVEAETLSCGTGVTASAIALARRRGLSGSVQLRVRTKGGSLEVRFDAARGGFSNVWLCGPAVEVFSGVYLLP